MCMTSLVYLICQSVHLTIHLSHDKDRNMVLEILHVSIYFTFLTMLIMLEPHPCGTPEKTDAAVLSLNERSYSPSL